jgi:hypothetical protein
MKRFLALAVIAALVAPAGCQTGVDSGGVAASGACLHSHSTRIGSSGYCR